MIRLYENSVEAQRHYLLVKNLIQNRIRNIINKGIKRDNTLIQLSTNLVIYLNKLLVDTDLEALITTTPSDLIKIIIDLKISNSNFFISSEDDNFVLRNIFIAHCYESPAFSKLDFIKGIPIDTCPYCNRNYIYHISKSGSIKPQIDHFYPKSIYPFLAASFYNLIPSCQTCNGFGAKEEKDPIACNLVNPYLLDHNSFKFTYKLKSNFIYSMQDKSSIEICFSKHLPGHDSIFKLKQLYSQHSDHVSELIVKSKSEYSKRYRAYLNSYKGIHFNDHEIDRMILGNYAKENEIHKRPLAKLYQDIGKELGLVPEYSLKNKLIL